MKLGDLVVYLKPLVLDFRQGLEDETELKLNFFSILVVYEWAI